jgi:UDP-2,3-diacylglucosamine pyrophosphatase LpxH
MPRTLVISDLHIGAYSGRCVLESPTVTASVFPRLGEFDRLILLGDALELGEGRPPAEVMAIAAPILEGLGRDVSEVVLIPGNHDRVLIRSWLLDQGDGLALENPVPTDATELLGEAAERLGSGGARVEVHYSGYRFSDRVWMTHGHYLDRLLVPDGPYGLFRRPPRHRPAAYETRQVLARKLSTVRMTHSLLTPRLSRLTSGGLDRQMRRHSLPALATLLGALGVRSEFLIFGHVHRLGPLPGDRPGQWQLPLAPGETPTRFLNTGSWQHEPVLVGHSGAPHPYRPGGAVVIESDGVPRAFGFLDGLDLDARRLPGAASR